MKTTFMANPNTIERKWYVVDEMCIRDSHQSKRLSSDDRFLVSKSTYGYINKEGVQLF